MQPNNSIIYNNPRNGRQALRITLTLSLMTMAIHAAFAADVANAPATDSSVAEAPMESITVAGQRRTAATRSRARQEQALNIINTTSQEEIRKLPDFNGGEAAARLPGVSLYVGTGQGRYIYIRGLDSDLTGTTYAGIHLPPTNPVTPQGGGRAFAFDSFPAGMIGTMTVTKTNVPAQDAEALGGTIEITPKRLAADEERFLDFRVGTGRRNARGTGLADLSVTGGVRFGGADNSPGGGMHAYSDKPFSFVGSLTYFQDQSGTDNWAASFANKGGMPDRAWSGFNQAYYRFHRATIGGGAELAYQPDADTRFYARYLHSGYREIVNRQKQTFKLSGTPAQEADGSLSSATTFDKSVRSMDERVSLDLFQVGGENRVGAAKLDYHLAYTEGKDWRPHDTATTFSAKPAGARLVYNNQDDLKYPSYRVSGADQLDPGLYKLSQLTDNTQTYKTEEWSGALNASMPAQLFAGASDEELKFGAAARYRTTTHTIDPYNSSAVPGLNMRQFIEGDPVSYYNGHYQNGYNLNPDAIWALFDHGNGAGFKGTATDAVSGLASRSRSTENVFAAYAQEQLRYGKLSLIGGLRVEATRANYGGYVTNPGLTAADPIQRGKNYVDLFPSLQARYTLQSALVARASYSRTIARPGFNQASPSATIDAALFQVSQGNPDLKPTISDNFDLSLERYLGQGGVLSLGLFDKQLSNYIVANTQTVNFLSSDPLFGALAGTPSRVISYTNLSSAHARGLELNYDQHYKMLPGWMSGLGTSFNWTHVRSKGELRPGESAALPSTARNTYNAQLYWEGERASARLAANYIGRSLSAIGKSAATDQFTEGRLSMDFGAGYVINRHLSAYVAARNLLDTANTTTEGNSRRVTQRETYGKTLMLGLTGHY